jgi:hypothetical protein
MIVLLYLGYAAIATVSAAFSAWIIMLLVGIAHLDWWAAIPPMSYGTAFTLMAVLVFGLSVPSIAVIVLKGAMR